METAKQTVATKKNSEQIAEVLSTLELSKHLSKSRWLFEAGVLFCFSFRTPENEKITLIREKINKTHCNHKSSLQKIK